MISHFFTIRYKIYRLLILLAFPGVVFAQFSCSSEVSYKWKKADAEEATILWSSIAMQGADEAKAKSGIEEKLTKEKKRASEACKDLHENMSGCLGAKYTAAASELRTLDFAAKKALQTAIASDCNSQQGRCKEITATEIKCVNLKPADAEAETGKEGKGKDKKK